MARNSGGSVACRNCSAVVWRPNKPDTVRIGAILPLTGDMAVFGESFKNGIELALHDLHKILGKRPR